MLSTFSERFFLKFSCMSFRICMVIYGWSIMEPGKGRCRQSPVSLSTIGRKISVMYRSHLPHSSMITLLCCHLKIDPERLAISRLASSGGNEKPLWCTHRWLLPWARKSWIQTPPHPRPSSSSVPSCSQRSCGRLLSTKEDLLSLPRSLFLPFPTPPSDVASPVSGAPWERYMHPHPSQAP